MSGVVNSEPIASSRQSIVISFPSGTKMVFNQTAAPTGWTKVTGSGDDHALRVTTGTVGTGGSVNFETAFESKTPTISTPTISMSNGAITLSTAQIPAHSHVYAHHGSTSSGTTEPQNNYRVSQYQDTQNTGGGGAHTHTNTASSNTPTSSAIDLNVKFVDIIIATKD